VFLCTLVAVAVLYTMSTRRLIGKFFVAEINISVSGNKYADVCFV